MSFAENTSVPVVKSKMELDGLLSKHGAGQRGIASDEDSGRAEICFSLKGRQYRLEVPLPKRGEFKTDPRNKWRSVPEAEQLKRYEQACRVRWRCVLLLLKAKLEIVSLGLSSFEKEFLADLVLPDGQRTHAMLGPLIEQAYLEGSMPRLLLGPGGE